MTVNEALATHGWRYDGTCGCTANKERWVSDAEKFNDQKIEISRKLGYFYHYNGVYCIKADYTENINRYLQTL